FDLRRPYPLAYPDGDFSEAGVAVHTVGEDNKSLRLDGLPSSFVISRGDYLAISEADSPAPAYGALYQSMETVVAVAGVTPSFEVRPHLRPGTAVNDPVILKQPSTVF